MSVPDHLRGALAVPLALGDMLTAADAAAADTAAPTPTAPTEATVRFPVPGRFRVVLLSEEAGLVPDRASATVVRVRPASG